MDSKASSPPGLSGVTVPTAAAMQVQHSLTLACLAIGLQSEAVVTAAVVAIQDAHTLMLAAVVSKVAVINHWKGKETHRNGLVRDISLVKLTPGPCKELEG